MADESPRIQHIYRLSALDQSVSRTYITPAFYYPCPPELTKKAVEGFEVSIRKTITNLPVLAGKLRTASNADGAQRGFLEIAVSIEMVDDFKISVKYLDGTEGVHASYHELLAKRFPAEKLEITQLAQLAQEPPPASGKAFAAQLNIIPGGVIAVLQLHHAVADLVSFQGIVEICSRDSRSLVVTNSTINNHAIKTSIARDLLSNPDGQTAGPSAFPLPPQSLAVAENAQSKPVTCVLGFNLKILDGTTEMVNVTHRKLVGHAGYIDPRGQPMGQPMQAFHVLAAMLWQGIIRARKAAGIISDLETTNVQYSTPPSKVIMPINIRKAMAPGLKGSYFGNAIVQAENHRPISKLGLRLELSDLAATAQTLVIAINDVTERFVRVAIAKAKQSNYTSNTITTAATSLQDVVITSWSDLAPEDASLGLGLGLGLGRPSSVRKLSGKDADEGCTVYRRPQEGEIWEVAVTLSPPAMEQLLADEGLMKFVQYADGERYTGGVTEFQAIGDRVNVNDNG